METNYSTYRPLSMDQILNDPTIDPAFNNHTIHSPKNNLNNYSKYIKVYGHDLDINRSFVAIHFTKHVIRLDFTSNETSSVQFPENSIVVLRGNAPLDYFVKNPSSLAEQHLIYRIRSNSQFNDGTVHVQEASQQALLRALFPPCSILVEAYHQSVFYCLTTNNPFKNIWMRNRRCRAFKALCSYANTYFDKELRFSLCEIMQFRFFKRNTHDPFKFSSWIELARKLFKERVRTHMPEINITTTFATYAFNCHEKFYNKYKNITIQNLPPADFYTCGITLCDDIPVGVAFEYCCITNTVKYVSPMIVSYVTGSYKDSNHVQCHLIKSSYCRVRNWIPFFKNKAYWEIFGLRWYLEKQVHQMLYSLLGWLSIQTSEKYQLMYDDLRIVFSFITINEDQVSRWPSRHSCVQSSSTIQTMDPITT